MLCCIRGERSESSRGLSLPYPPSTSLRGNARRCLRLNGVISVAKRIKSDATFLPRLSSAEMNLPLSSSIRPSKFNFRQLTDGRHKGLIHGWCPSVSSGGGGPHYRQAQSGLKERTGVAFPHIVKTKAHVINLKVSFRFVNGKKDCMLMLWISDSHTFTTPRRNSYFNIPKVTNDYNDLNE